MLSLSLRESAGLWTPVEARLTGLEETAGPSPCPVGGSSHSRDSGRGAAPRGPVTFQVGHFPEPRCLLMSWGERLSALYPRAGPRITSAPRGWPRASSGITWIFWWFRGHACSFVCDLFSSKPASSAAPGHQAKSMNTVAKGTALRLQSCRWEGVSADSAVFVISSASLTSTAVSSECILLVEVNGGWDSRNPDPL